MGIVYATDDDFKIGVWGETGDGTALAASDSFISSSANRSEPIKIQDDAFGITLSHNNTTTTGKVTFLPAGAAVGKTVAPFIREPLKTNPVGSNEGISNQLHDYWLGETFEEAYVKLSNEHAGEQMYVFVSKLSEQFEDFSGQSHQMRAAKTGWVIPQHFGDSGSFDIASADKLFRLVSLQEGECGNNYFAKIEKIDIKIDTDLDPWTRFDIVIYDTANRAQGAREVRKFSNLDLNPNSSNYIAKVLGDQYFEWDSASKVNRVYNSHPVTNPYVRVEMHPNIVASGVPNKRYAPFGFLGPIQPADIKDVAAASSKVASTDKWVDGGADFTNFGTSVTDLDFKWPQCPHVISGSQDFGYCFGATYRGLDRTFGEVEDGRIEGAIDFYRRMPATPTGGDDIAGDQASGVTSAATKHSYMFSLDEIVISSNRGAVPETDLDGENAGIATVVYVEGSHAAQAGRDAILGAQAHVTMSLDFDSTVAAATSSLDGQEFSLQDVSGQTVTFHFSDAIDQHADAKVKMINVAGETRAAISIKDLDTEGGDQWQNLQDRIVDAINYMDEGNGDAFGNVVFDLDITAAEGTEADPGAGDNPAAFSIVLTQEDTGAAGNRNIGVSANFPDTITFSNSSPNRFLGGVTAVDAVVGTNGTAYTSLTSSNGYNARELVQLVNSFAMPFHGGFDGVDITESDPFNMRTRAIGPDSTPRSSYAHASVARAIDSIRDPELLEHKIAVMPGISNKTLTNKLLQVCEARGDSLLL